MFRNSSMEQIKKESLLKRNCSKNGMIMKRILSYPLQVGSYIACDERRDGVASSSFSLYLLGLMIQEGLPTRICANNSMWIDFTWDKLHGR